MIIIFVISGSFSDTPKLYGLIYNSLYLSLPDVQSILIHRSHVIASRVAMYDQHASTPVGLATSAKPKYVMLKVMFGYCCLY